VDLRSHALRLVGLTVGEELAPGVRLASVASADGLRWAFAVGERTLHIEAVLLDDDRRHAARSLRLGFSYRVDGDGALGLGELGRTLCQRLAERSAPREVDVLAAIAAEAARARDSGDGGQRIRELTVDALLERAGTHDQPYLTFSPYVGCLIGCRFCYAQGRLADARRLEQLPQVPWGSYVDVRINAAEVLRRELATAPRLPIKLCPIVSDPYQAVEAKYRVVRACLEVLAAARPSPPVLVLTRSSLILRDLDVLQSLPRLWVGLSIPTLDDEVRRHFEPRASPIADRLDALRQLRAANIRTFAIVQPLLPGPIDEFADALAASTTSVRIDVLHGLEGADPDFADPRYVAAASPTWQSTRATALSTALTRRHLPLWPSELPPDLPDLGTGP